MYRVDGPLLHEVDGVVHHGHQVPRDEVERLLAQGSGIRQQAINKDFTRRFFCRKRTERGEN